MRFFVPTADVHHASRKLAAIPASGWIFDGKLSEVGKAPLERIRQMLAEAVYRLNTRKSMSALEDLQDAIVQLDKFIGS